MVELGYVVVGRLGWDCGDDAAGYDIERGGGGGGLMMLRAVSAL